MPKQKKPKSEQKTQEPEPIPPVNTAPVSAQREPGDETEFPGPEGREIPNLSDVYRKMEGSKVAIEELLDKPVIVRHYMKHEKSAYSQRPYVSVQVELDGQPRYFHTASESLRHRLERTSELMPYKAKLIRKKSANNMEYLSLE